MRLNKYIASSTTLSRRKADEAIAQGRVSINGRTAEQGQDVSESDTVALDGRAITPSVNTITIMLNKPRGYVVSRNGQGSQTVYDLLPPEYQHLNPVGRLDKDSSGLLLLTNDGALAQELTHPSRQKVKVYEVTLDDPLHPLHQQMITDYGVMLEDGLSKFAITKLDPHSRVIPSTAEESPRNQGRSFRSASDSNRDDDTKAYEITMAEGRNRQIRRTFAALGYTVQTLHRTHFGPYALGNLAIGQHQLT